MRLFATALLVALAAPTFAQTTPLEAWQKKGAKYSDGNPNDPTKAKRHCACLAPLANRLGFLLGGDLVSSAGDFTVVMSCAVPIYNSAGAYTDYTLCSSWVPLK